MKTPITISPSPTQRLRYVNTILFDFDGVLFQTIEDHYTSWQHAFATIGRKVQWEDFAKLEGQSFYAIARQLGNILDLTEDEIQNIAEIKNRHYLRHHQSKPYPDAEKTIQYFVQQKWAIGLVTGAFRERIDRTLPESWKPYFSCIITADDVGSTKPDPEPYLLAAQKLGKSVKECLVIENAPLGVQSALSAGMLCMALTTTLPQQYLLHANWIATSLSHALHLLSGFIHDAQP